jgi:hypothetical protein
MMATTIMAAAIAASAWTPGDTQAELTLVALSAVDVMQTRAFLRMRDENGCYRFREENPVLGERPGALRLYGTAAAALAVHAAIAYVLPQPARAVWQGAVIGIEAAMVARTSIMVGSLTLQW